MEENHGNLSELSRGMQATAAGAAEANVKCNELATLAVRSVGMYVRMHVCM